MNKLLCALPLMGFACTPVATIEGGEIFGVDFVPGSAIVQPSDAADTELTVIIGEDADLCEQVQGGAVDNTDVKLFALQIVDADPLAPGDYSVDSQGNTGATFIRQEGCEDEGFFAVSASGTITLDSFTAGGDASGSFDTTLAELDFGGGLPNTDSVDGTFNATFCDFDPDEVEDPCAEQQ
jgi:hypothetical protein